MNKRLIILAILFTIYYLLFTIFSPAYAQEKDALSLAISPPILEITARYPAKTEAQITIKNQSDNNQNFNITIRPFKAKSTADGQIEYLPAGNDTPFTLISKKINIYEGNLPISKVGLAAHEEKSLKLGIDIDSNNLAGDYYFSVLFISEATAAPGEKSFSQTGGGVATNVILTVGEKSPARGEILDFSAPFFIPHGPVPITLLLQNDSDRHITPTGKITIHDMFNHEVGRVDIIPQYILAGSKRYMTSGKTASEAQIAGHSALIWPEKFLFGIYTATAVVKLSDTGPTFNTSVSFVSLPLYLVFGLSFIAFILLSIYIKVKKKI